MISTLKMAEPTHADIMAAKSIGMGHPYWAGVIHAPYYANGAIEHTESAREYRRLLEVVMCRERQLELAVAILSDEQRERVGV